MPATQQTRQVASDYYAPAVRVLGLGDTLQPGRVPGSAIPGLDRDILAVEVTQVHHGSSSYKITLNNWDDAIASSRRDRPAKYDPASGPVWPPYKYNDFTELRFGRRLRIDFSYWPDKSASGKPDGAKGRPWIPMIAGAIVDMQFSFGQEGARLVVTGKDDIRHLTDRNPKRQPYDNHSEESIIRDTLDRVRANSGNRYSFHLADLLRIPDFMRDRSQGIEETHPKDQSYLQFIGKFCERFDLEIFMAFSSLVDPEAGVKLHVEQARSRIKPDDKAVELVWGQNLLSFTPKIDVGGQVTRTQTIGKHRVRARPVRVDQAASGTDVKDEIHDAGHLPGSEHRKTAFGDNHAEPGQHETNLDDVRAKEMAIASMRRKARELLTIDASTLGNPMLRPGSHVKIRGFGPPFDGFYYVTEATHTYDTSGYLTRFSARRPGMPKGRS